MCLAFAFLSKMMNFNDGIRSKSLGNAQMNGKCRCGQVRSMGPRVMMILVVICLLCLKVGSLLAVREPPVLFAKNNRLAPPDVVSLGVTTANIELLEYVTSKDSNVIRLKSAWYDAARAVSASAQKEKGQIGAMLHNVGFSTWRHLVNVEEQKTVFPPPTIAEYLENSAPLCDAHAEQITQLWGLIKSKGSMRHLNETESNLVIDALSIAYISLRDKRTRSSLEESIHRAAGIAAVLGELRADLNVVLAGILHEVVAEIGPNDAHMTRLRERIGSDPVDLAAAYALLPQFMARRANYTDMQAENQIQMLVALAGDYRTLYIRLADRLHTLRMLRKLPLSEEDRCRIAREARHVYAPLAHKMGVMKVRGELEDLAFRLLEPDMFLRTRYTQTAASKAYQDAADRIEQLVEGDRILQAKGAQLRMTYRIKSKYQLYLKMQRKDLKSPNDVRDALGLRLIVDIPRVADESDAQFADRKSALCYYIVERLRRMPGWEPARDGFKDYILNEKRNGYQSLHQYIRHLALGTNVEVQVRTRDMHYTAELGGAAHWCYKDEIYRPDVARSKLYRLAWRSPAQLEAKSAAELIGLAKQQLLASRVFVYLEDMSTVINLPRGATALDAAFAIHTSMGLTATEVRVNGRAVEMGHAMQTGDVVAVECSNASVSNHGSEGVPVSKLTQVRTRCALAALRRYFKEQDSSLPLQRAVDDTDGVEAVLTDSVPVNQPIFSTPSTRRGMSRTTIIKKPFSPQAAAALTPSERRRAKDDYARLYTASTRESTGDAQVSTDRKGLPMEEAALI